MTQDKEVEPGKVGIIPDFFHDIIAYIIPGYTALLLVVSNFYVIGVLKTSCVNDVDLKSFSLSLIAAYVIGRFFEQIGYMTIHHRRFPFLCLSSKFPFLHASPKVKSPKWSLILDENDGHYTEQFKNNVIKKIAQWLKKQDGDSLVMACKDKGKDDYFNLIQFYLRERFPTVALYEKKQNATIVLTRSLAIIFIFSILTYFILLLQIKLQSKEVVFSFMATCWLLVNLLFSCVFYMRFQQDKVYHAMYIFETFIAMKKLLKNNQDNDREDK